MNSIAGSSLAKSIAFAAFVLAFLTQTVISQTAAKPGSPDQEAILKVVQTFFDTMAARDAKGAAEIFAEEGRFYSVRVIDGKKVVRTFSNREHLEGLPVRKDDWYERMWDPQVFIRGDIASVWTPYDFWVNGEWSHCGIDQVTLVRIEGKWKITGGAYTVEKECEPSPLGPLKK